MLPCTLSACPMVFWLFVWPGSGAAARFKCSSCHLGCGSITTTSRNMCGERHAARGMRHAALLNRKQPRQKCFGTFYTFCCWARVCLDIWKTYCTIYTKQLMNMNTFVNELNYYLNNLIINYTRVCRVIKF